MKRALLALTLAAPLALGAVGCGATLTVDGYGVEYVNRPAIEGAHRYTHNGVAVYEVGGRYYREYQGRWVAYGERPRELQEEKAQEKREEKPAERREEHH